MKYNPLTKTLFTDKGEFIKELNCPFKPKWEVMQSIQGELSKRNCSFCDHSVLDTMEISDENLLEIVRKKPDTCLKIDPGQPNVILSLSTYGI